MHRAWALVVAGLLLHLNVLGIERACAPRHVLREHTELTAHADHTGGEQHPESPPPQAPSDQCCEAMSVCVTTLALAADRDSADQLQPGAEIAMARNTEHTTAVLAPDPPPPRA